MTILGVILARSQSPDEPGRLLPRRPLARVAGRPVLSWILDRLADSRTLNRLAVAVGDRDQDRDIIELIGDRVPVYAGHPDDVLDRLHLAAKAENADHVVRINGNFPLVDPEGLDRLVAAHLERGADFSLNSHYHGLVYGLGVEIISRQALDRLADENLTPAQRGIGSHHLLHHPEKYTTFFYPAEKTAPHLRVSIDYQADLAVVEEILAHAPKPDNNTVIDFLAGRPDLTAAQEMTGPAEVSLEKALLFPEKIQSLRRNNCVTIDETYPISVELSLTNRCNHQCVWCSDADLRERLGGRMELGRLTSLFDDLRTGGVRGVVIEGGGEPTLHPAFDRAVTEARRRDLALGLITNGFLCPYLDRLADFEWVRISLDAATRRQYKDLKGRDGFNRVISNLMNLAALKKTTTLGVGYVVTNRNDDPAALEQLVLFLRKIGLNYIQFRPVIDHPELASEVDLGFLKKYENNRFAVNISGMSDNRVSGNAGLPCLAHSLSTVIAADGSVFLCGRLNTDETWESIGNLSESSFQEIWTGPRRREQIRTVSQAEFCRMNCPECRMTKYNRLLSDLEKIRTKNFI